MHTGSLRRHPGLRSSQPRWFGFGLIIRNGVGLFRQIEEDRYGGKQS